MEQSDNEESEVELSVEQGMNEESKEELTENGNDDLQTIPNIFAKFPSDNALKQMATSFGLKREYTTTSSVLITEIFNDLLQHQKVLIDKTFKIV